MISRRAALAAPLMALPPVIPARASDEGPVEVVLLADVSFSMEQSERELQRRAYVAALTSPDVIRAIVKNAPVAFAYVEFGLYEAPRVICPLTVIDSPERLVAFRTALERAPMINISGTNVGAAMQFADGLFTTAARRRVIDVSGDGIQAEGVKPKPADALLDSRTVVNGLPLVAMGDAGVAEWYRSEIAGPRGGFVIPFDGEIPLDRVIAMKIASEIAGVIPPGAFA